MQSIIHPRLENNTGKKLDQRKTEAHLRLPMNSLAWSAIGNYSAMCCVE